MGKRNLSIFNLALVVLVSYSSVFFWGQSAKASGRSQIEYNRMQMINPRSEGCPVPLENLTFVGRHFESAGYGTVDGRHYVCVNAGDDSAANSACGGDASPYTAVNPDNPQYGLVSFGSSNAQRAVSSRGWYYCVPKSFRNSSGATVSNGKPAMCGEANDNTDYNPNRMYTFQFQHASGRRDGDCQCYLNATASAPRGQAQLDCSQPEVRDLANGGTPARTQDATEPSNSDTPTSASAATSADFTRCVDQAKSSAALCKIQAQSAQHDCNPSNVQVSDPASAAAGAAGSLASVYAQMNAGTGSQSSCFTAGLLSNAARMAASQANDSCKDNVSLCTNTCGQDEGAKYEEFRQCATKLLKPDGQAYSPEELETGTTQEARYYQAAQQQVHDDFQTGRQICQRDGAAKQDVLNNMLYGVGNALASSLRCACQLSSSATVSTAKTTTGATQGGCNAANIPTAQDCTLNPSLSGCQVYSELSVCTPGSSYNAALCRCQTNPSADGCSKVTTTGTVASMAGSAVKAGGYAGTNGFTIPPSSGSANNLDLSGGSDSSGIGLQAKSPGGVAGSRQPYVGGGSGGDSGGGRGGVPNGATAMGAGKDDNGILGGLMNAIKTGARTLGFSRDQKNGNYRDARNGNKGSGDGFRPRGLAGNNSGMGGKHMEIWTMMNRCMQAETCPSNTGQFILTP